jgi:parallel beta-helix repeat protein
MTDRRDAPWDEQVHEPDTERLLSEWFEDEAPTREPAVLAPNVIARTALTRRRSRVFVRDWWRDLFRLPQRPSLSPILAVGGTAVVTVLLVLGLTLPGGFLGQSDSTGEILVPGEAIVVNPDDEKVKQTIAEAIEWAEDGETVFIFPGEYVENLRIIDKTIELVGGGNVGDVILRPANDDEPILLIDGGQSTIRNFTIRGPGNSVRITAAEPTFTGMVFDGVGDQWWTYTGADWDGFQAAAQSIFVELFSNPTISGNTFIGGGEIEITGASDATIAGNTLIEGAAIFLSNAGDDTVVSGNTIDNSGLFSIESNSCSELTIEDNVITQPDPGVAIQALCLKGVIRDNTIDGAATGIRILEGTTAEITGNVIDTQGVALEINADAEPSVSDNELCGENAIMAVNRGAMRLDLSDNELCEGVPLVFE